MANNIARMWDRLWLNARIATMAPDRPYGLIAEGALAVDGDRFAWVGEQSSLPAPPERCARCVDDLGGRLVTPGLVDCHTHLVYGGNRAREFEMRLEGASYEQIARAGGGILSTVAATRATSFDELLHASLGRAEQMLRNGTTTIEIKSGYGLDLETETKILRVAREVGRRLEVDVHTTYLGAHAIPPEYGGHADHYISLVCEPTLRELAAEGLVDAVDAFFERIAFDRPQTEHVFRCAEGLGLRVKLHADQLSDGGGAALAAQHRALSADHLDHTSDAGVAALAKAGTVAVLLPGASYFLREAQKPPVAALRSAGVPIAIATDCNPGTSPLVSLPLTMNLGCTLFGLTTEEALRAVTVHAAHALGVERDIGTVATGMVADFAVWDAMEPAELAYAIGATSCVAVVKRGVPVFDNSQESFIGGQR